MATELSSLTYLNTPTFRTTHIEFSDVAITGTTGLVVQSNNEICKIM